VWPEHGLVVEFDGRAKYLRDVYTGGKSAGEIVLAESIVRTDCERSGCGSSESIGMTCGIQSDSRLCSSASA
jgi:hypothetical protein